MPTFKKFYDLQRRLYNEDYTARYVSHEDLSGWFYPSKIDQTGVTTQLRSLVDPIDYLVTNTGDDIDLSNDTPTRMQGFTAKSLSFDRTKNLEANSVNSFHFNDKFSVAFWIKPSTVPQYNTTFKNFIVSHGNSLFSVSRNAFTIALANQVNSNTDNESKTGSYIEFSIGDNSAGGDCFVYSKREIIPDNWYHVVCTYDGNPGNFANLEIYINGKESTHHRSNHPLFLDPESKSPYGFSIGGFYGDTQSIFRYDGLIAEVGLWEDELTSGEVKALYKPIIYKSGYLSSNPRLTIRDQDYRTGSYPTNLRTGDKDFSGNSTSNAKFDDTSTIIWKSSQPIGRINFNRTKNSFGHILGISSSLGAVKKDFEFVEIPGSLSAGGDNPPGRLSSSTPVYVETENITTFGPELTPVEPLSSRHFALALSKEINETSGLGIRSYVESGSVILTREDHNIVGGTITSKLIDDEGNHLPKDDNFCTIQQFEKNSEIVNLATRLSPDSRYRDNLLNQPNVMQDLKAEASVIPGVSDVGIHFTPGENISPFEDSRIPNLNLKNSGFYTSGTSPSILDGFDSSLGSKVIFSIDLQSRSELGRHLYFTSQSYRAHGAEERNIYTVGVNDFVDSDLPEFYVTNSAGPIGTYHGSIAGKVTGSAGVHIWSTTKNEFYGLNTSKAYITNPRAQGYLFDDLFRTRIHSRGFSEPFYGTDNINTDVNNFYRAKSTDDSKAIRDKMYRHDSICHPVTTHGFHGGYISNITSSNTIAMSDYISQPFLLEKIRIDVDGVFGINSLTDDEVILYRKFFILCQPTKEIKDDEVQAGQLFFRGVQNALIPKNIPNVNHHVYNSQQRAIRYWDYKREWGYYNGNGTPTLAFTEVYDASYQNTSFEEKASAWGKKQLVTYARVGISKDTNNFKTLSEKSDYVGFTNNYDAFIEITNDDIAKRGVTSSFTMELTPRMPNRAINAGIFRTNSRAFSVFENRSDAFNPNYPAVSFQDTFQPNGGWPINGDYDPDAPVYHVDSCEGGGDALGNVPTRHIAASLEDADDNPFATGSMTFSLTGGDVTIKPKKDLYSESPFLLLPSDRLVIGYENIPEILATNCDQINADENVDRIKRVKITLFGSQVSNEKEYVHSTNQPLTSDGIHEALISSPVVDQWDVESSPSFSGSYVSDLMFGSIAGDPGNGERGVSFYPRSGIKLSVNHRWPLGRDTFYRNVKLLDNFKVHGDTIPPNLGEYAFSVTGPGASGGAHQVHRWRNLTSTKQFTTHQALRLGYDASNPFKKLLRDIGIFSRPDVKKTQNGYLPKDSFTFDGIDRFNTAAGQNYQHIVVDLSQSAEPNIVSGTLGYSQLYLNYHYTPRISFSPFSTSNTGYVERSFPSPNYRANDGGPKSIRNFLSETTLIVNETKEQIFNKFKWEIDLEQNRDFHSIFLCTPKFSRQRGERHFPLSNYKSRYLTFTLNMYAFVEPTGFKYGLANSTPCKPMYHYKRDSYGQFRDMLEAPPETWYGSTYEGRLENESANSKYKVSKEETEPPVKVTFITRDGEVFADPLSTNSQNLSIYSTSSFPYYDGIEVDRDTVAYPYPDPAVQIQVDEETT